MFSGLWVIASMRAEIKILHNRLQGVEVSINKITDILVNISRQDERIRALEERINSMNDRGSRRLQQILEEHFTKQMDS